MSKSFSARLLAALDRRDIPPHVRREVHNQVCGPNAEDPPALAWDTLYSDVLHYLRNLRSNKSKVRSELRSAWQSYYDVVSTIPPRIRAADKSQPPSKELSQWQGWIPAEERARHIAAFAVVYDAHPNMSHNGLRTVPFAPNALRAENLERVRRCETAIAAAREAWNTSGTPTHPRSDTHIGAVILAAARQAELALKRYKQRLLRHEAHPYEEPAKANWQHYCDAETRAKVRRLSVNPADVYFDFAPYAAFYAATHQ